MVLCTSEQGFQLFDKAKQLCISFAEQSGYDIQKQTITVINAEQTAVYGKDTGRSKASAAGTYVIAGVLLSPNLIFSSVLAHEMIHSMNIGHSYSDRTKRVSFSRREKVFQQINSHFRVIRE